MKSAQALHALLAPTVTALGFELYACIQKPHSKGMILTLLVDSQQGINLDQCAKVSRSVAAILDVEDPISGAYQLEVSSPGMERPLLETWHYERVIGDQVLVRLRHGIDGRRTYQGTLRGVTDQSIELLLDDGVTWSTELGQVEKARRIAQF